MESVIDTLLAVARGEATRSRGAASAEGAAKLAVEALGPAGARVALASSANGMRVGADEDVVVQALQPLLDNALRHARAQVTLRVSRERTVARFEVEDDGEGTAGLDADALFEPGTSSVGSAGLGLALARRLARSCGGDVTAEAGAPGGRFVLRLPAVA